MARNKSTPILGAYEFGEGVMSGGFPQRLRSLREKKRVSRRVLADFCQLSKSAVARYERGEREPTAGTICRIADYFEVSADYLLGREKNF